ncbi:MAG: MarR family transcriptional regulator [Pseudomonadota bacterium]|nr:MarR family transcriptional regulator [Pseudomonadota bacterium]
MAMTQRQALDLWRCALTSYVRSDESDMTARQQAVLMTVALAPGPHTVRGLSQHLNIAKPAVTRALDVLEKNHFIRRIPDENDLRSVHIERTTEGMNWLRAFGGRIQAAEAGEMVSEAPTELGRAVA